MTEETDGEAQGLDAPQSPLPTEPAVSGDRGLEYEIPMEGLDHQEMRKGEDVKYEPYVNEESEGRELAGSRPGVGEALQGGYPKQG